MDKNEEIVLCVTQNDIKSYFKSKYKDNRNNVIREPLYKFSNSLLAKTTKVMPRSKAEIDKNIRHFIVYVPIFRFNENGQLEIFVYQRTNKIGDIRLGGKFSIGIGGHVEDKDISSSGVFKNTILNAFTRELKEEVKITNSKLNKKNYSLTHVILDNSDIVGRVHIGVTGMILLTSNNFKLPRVKLLETEQLINGEFWNYEELLQNINKDETFKEQFESWSSLLLSKINFNNLYSELLAETTMSNQNEYI